MLWMFSALVLWFWGFFKIASRWQMRGTRKSMLFLFLLFVLNVFFAYYIAFSRAEKELEAS